MFSHSYSIEFATLYGVECAVLINHFHHWITINKAAGRNFHEGKTWMYQSAKEIASIYPYWSEDIIFRSIKKLVDFGVLVKGNFNKSKYDRTVWYAFKNEKIFSIPQNRGMKTSKSRNGDCESAEPIPDTIPVPIPKPKPAKQKGNAPLPPKSEKGKEKGEGKGIGKALPFSKKEKIEKTPPSKQRKFKRSEEHQAAFEWLLSLGLTDSEGEVDPDEMSYLSHAYSRQKLENAWCHLLYKTENEKLKPKCIIALFKHLLKNEHNPIGASNNENVVFAKKFAKKHNWTSLEIKEKYVIDNNFPGKDIPLNITPSDFCHSLENLYNSLR